MAVLGLNERAPAFQAFEGGQEVEESEQTTKCVIDLREFELTAI